VSVLNPGLTVYADDNNFFFLFSEKLKWKLVVRQKRKREGNKRKKTRKLLLFCRLVS
jgi:hypothetical protein